MTGAAGVRRPGSGGRGRATRAGGGGEPARPPAEYLARLEAESEFADVPQEKMTPEQRQELAARYNGGPYWQGDDAQAYGRAFPRSLDDAKGALQ